MFAFSRLLSAIPITPGGVGIIDLGYIGGLTAFDSAEKAQIVAAVLLFRLLTYGIQSRSVGSRTSSGGRRRTGAARRTPPRRARRVSYFSS